MKIPMSDGGVPFVITYRKILRKPKMKRERKFVGFVQLAKSLLLKAIEVVEANAFETTTEYVEPGQSVAVHWAIGLEDPFDTRPGMEKNLVAYRMMDDIPPNGLHFEVYIPDRKEPSEMSPEEAAQREKDAGPQTNLAHDLTPEQFETLRRRQQQEDILGEGRSVNGSFQRPPASEYNRRPVRTIDEELLEEAPKHEEPADVDGASSVGEDD